MALDVASRKLKLFAIGYRYFKKLKNPNLGTRFGCKMALWEGKKLRSLHMTPYQR